MSLEKSFDVFRKNVAHEVRDEISTLLNVKVVAQHDKY